MYFSLKRIMSEDITFIFKHPFELFMVLFMVFVGIHYRNINNLDDITKVYAEITAVSGGFTSAQYNDLVEDLEKIGYASDSTSIKIKATAPDGTDLSSKVINVTPPSQTPYPTKPIYVPRGTKIVLTVKSSKKSLLTNIYKWVNIESNISLGNSRRVYMSERVE